MGMAGAILGAGANVAVFGAAALYRHVNRPPRQRTRYEL
jgi:hypothetical protein